MVGEDNMSRAMIILGLSIVFNATANILIKVGMNRLGKVGGVFMMVKKAIVEPALVLGVFSFVLALAGYSFVLTKLNLSVAYPIMISMGLIIVVLASYFLLNESISGFQILGFLLIIAGVWLVAR